MALNALVKALKDPALSSQQSAIVSSLCSILRGLGVNAVGYLPKVSVRIRGNVSNMTNDCDQNEQITLMNDISWEQIAANAEPCGKICRVCQVTSAIVRVLVVSGAACAVHHGQADRRAQKPGAASLEFIQ